MEIKKLHREDWEVKTVALEVAHQLVQLYHYAKGGPNTATFRHGLFPRGSFWDCDCMGVAWWIPPTKNAALATYPEDWRCVLSLSRLVVVPNAPKNAASFLIAGSMKLIDRDRWPCLVTYADEWQGHTGAIYRATNWDYKGLTAPEPTFVLGDRLISRKAGPITRTRAEMEALGARMVGSYSKHKFVHIQSQ